MNKIDIHLKHQELKQKEEILILDVEESQNFNIVIFNQEYSDAFAFLILLDNYKRVVIKPFKYCHNINLRDLSRKADQLYSRKETELAIKAYETILLLTKKTSPHVYARLGLLYLSLDNYSLSIKFLQIATGLSNIRKNHKYDFTKLINSLTWQESLFTNELENFYGITKIKDVSILMNYEGMTVDEACLALNINEEEKSMILLLFAREYYALKCFKQGDEYIKRVLKTPYKSERIKHFLEELKLNRKFYQNRIDENYTPKLLSWKHL